MYSNRLILVSYDGSAPSSYPSTVLSATLWFQTNNLSNSNIQGRIRFIDMGDI